MFVTLLLAKNIRERRHSLNLTQRALADKLFVSPQAVSRWEVGVSCPNVDILPRLASALQLDYNTLLGYNETCAGISRRTSTGRGVATKG